MIRLLIALTAAFGFLLTGCGGSAVTPVSRAADAVSPPINIEIPALNKTSSLTRLGLNSDKTVQVPPLDQPQQAGWYAFSSKPGDPGPAVILGHIDGNHKKGVFYQLGSLKPGDRVIIERSDSTKLTYAVTRVHRVDKDEFPTDEVYGNTPDSELRLITCGGAFEGGQTGYADNIIVNARII